MSLRETIGNETYLRLSITRDPDATGVIIEGQVSTTLDPSAWTTQGVEIEANTATEFRVRDSLPMSSGNQRFMRLRFSQL